VIPEYIISDDYWRGEVNQGEKKKLPCNSNEGTAGEKKSENCLGWGR